MKVFKSLFKQVFGNHKEGMQYAEQLVKKEKAPVLFIHGDQSKEFASLLSKLVDDTHSTSVEEFDVSHTTDVIHVEAGSKIDTNTVISAVKAAHRDSKRIIFSMDKRPSELDNIFDPMFKVVEVSGIDLSEATDEVNALKDHLS